MFKKPNLIHIWRIIRYGVENANRMSLEDQRVEIKQRLHNLVRLHESQCVELRRETNVRRNELERARMNLLRLASNNQISENDRNRIGELTREICSLRSNERKKLDNLKRAFRKERDAHNESLDALERLLEDQMLGNMA